MKILIVEDEQNIAHFLKESLEAEYFAVDLAEDGEYGSHLAQINEYDLIILDDNVPKKDGIEVIREIREGGVAAPVIVMSHKDDSAHTIRLLNAGADDCLPKPFVLGELLARARALLRRPKTLEKPVYSIGDLTVNTRACTVTRGEKQVYLTRKEFMLLHYLMQNEGVVLSRGMILEHVWDMNTNIFSNTIESHMLSLRKKIGDYGNQRLIHTIPGRGYRIST
ncbi:MAG TPA: response regulator transcription factor [Candidatus Paceibacterota bacterium]|nr:response regulator transcription factor [Candidatus Paceibacterota bacterium]